MKANELMIGDWVQDITPVVIDAISNEDICTYRTKHGYITANPSNLKPILLTAEILEKNGWKDISDHTLKGCETFKLHYEQRAFDFYITIKLRDYFKLESYDDRFYTLCEMEFGCRFVHQLQHALRLCGIDKEIVL